MLLVRVVEEEVEVELDDELATAAAALEAALAQSLLVPEAEEAVVDVPEASDELPSSDDVSW